MSFLNFYFRYLIQPLYDQRYVPERSIGSSVSPFLTWSDSPVMALSSTFKSLLWIIMPSAGNRSPVHRSKIKGHAVSSVPATRLGLQVSRHCYKHNLDKRPMVLMSLHIAPPARAGQSRTSWRMNTNCRQWDVWASRLVDWLKMQILPTPGLFGAFIGVTAFEYQQDIWQQKTTDPGLPCGILCMILWLDVLTQYRHVTNARTDRRTHDES